MQQPAPAFALSALLRTDFACGVTAWALVPNDREAAFVDAGAASAQHCSTTTVIHAHVLVGEIAAYGAHAERLRFLLLNGRHDGSCDAFAYRPAMLGSLPAGVQRWGVTMQYRKLGTTGVSVSELCLGTMMFGAPTDQKRSNEWSQQVRA
jgi:hypothetical protein